MGFWKGSEGGGCFEEDEDDEGNLQRRENGNGWVSLAKQYETKKLEDIGIEYVCD